MNKNSMPLTRQEVRRAAYRDAPLVRGAVDLLESLSKLAPDDRPFFAWLGPISKSRCWRFEDEEFLIELAIANIAGAQERRDTIDEKVSSTARDPEKVERGIERLGKLIEWTCEYVLPEGGLRSLNFNKKIEDDFYSLLLAFKAMKLGKSYFERNGDALRFIINERRRAIREHYRWVQSSGTLPKPSIQNQAQVSRYVKTYVGQSNSQANRNARATLWKEWISGYVGSLDPVRVADKKCREAVWLASASGKCAVCGEDEDETTFVAGHKIPWSVGGRTKLSNLQVECRACSVTESLALKKLRKEFDAAAHLKLRRRIRRATAKAAAAP